MNPTTLAPDRYFSLIDDGTSRLLAMGALGLEAAVPSCPGWRVHDVTAHVAQVYAHKVRVMADGKFPDDWPPPDHETREPVSFLRDERQALFDEFGRHDLSETTATFGADTTIGFWVRRMALEVAVHRYDAELAHERPTPIPDDLSLDGIDELLRVMVGGPWWDGDDWHTEHPVDGVVAVESGGRRWLVDLGPTSVTVTGGDESSADPPGDAVLATVSGSPEHVFLWLWGRLGDDAIEVGGDPAAASEFRQRIIEVSD